jgi:23S rRNA (adenine2503-C2)-methyltransferase
MKSIPILSHTQKSFAEAIFALLGRGRHHASILYSEWFRQGQLSPDAKWIEPQARSLVGEILALTDMTLPESTVCKEEGKAVKFLLKYPDQLESESVLIPMEAGITLCISSQVGCKMGCAFCETGRMGLLRNLTAAEIVSQVFHARFALGAKVRNLVFMGMGEPLDNFEEVAQALRVLTDPGGFGFGRGHVTVSTSGCVDGIYRLMKEAPAVNLAVSVNAPNDAIRQRIMPVNKKWSMAELKAAMQAYCEHSRREIFIEYVLLKGINDSLESAGELAAYLEGLKVKVNLIPYNPQSRDHFAPPEGETMESFSAALREKGYQVTIRYPKGQGIMAACGQLGNLNLRRRKSLLGIC